MGWGGDVYLRPSFYDLQFFFHALKNFLKTPLQTEKYML